MSLDVSFPNLWRVALERTAAIPTGDSLDLDNIPPNYLRLDQLRQLLDLETSPIKDALKKVISDPSETQNLSGLADTQKKWLIRLCTEGQDKLFDLSGLIPEHKIIFTNSLHCILDNKTGFQRIMSLITIFTLNIYRNTKILKLKTQSSIPVVNGSTFCYRQHDYKTGSIRLNFSKSMRRVCQSTMHEISHAYHDSVGISYISGLDYVNYSIMNFESVRILNELYPHLSPDKIGNQKKLTRYRDIPLSQRIDQTWKWGFGCLLNGQNIPTAIQRSSTAMNTYATVSSELRKNFSIIPVSAWGNPEEVLTMRGFFPLWFNEVYCVIEDRQNDNVFSRRESATVKYYPEKNWGMGHRTHLRLSDENGNKDEDNDFNRLSREQVHNSDKYQIHNHDEYRSRDIDRDLTQNGINELFATYFENVRVSDDRKKLEIDLEHTDLNTFENVASLPLTNLYSSVEEITITGVTSKEQLSEINFSEFEKLKKVNLPWNLKIIKDNTFQDCEQLKEITFGEDSSGEQALESIGKYAFAGCCSLERITIPESVTLIGEGAFKDCQSLGEVTFGRSSSGEQGLKIIRQYAFAGCMSLKEMNIPGSVKIIEEETFEDCPRLRTVTLV